MKKILFVSIDLLKKEIDGVDMRAYRDQFMLYADELCSNDEENEIAFVSIVD